MSFYPSDARPHFERRAFSLLELTAVLAIVGLIAGMAVTRWGGEALAVGSAEGFARQVSLALKLARRQAIAEGVPAAVVFTRSGGEVSSATVVRVLGAETQTESTLVVPDGVDVAPDADRWQFDFSGSLTTPAAGGQITLDTAELGWEINVNAATGHVGIVREY